MEQIMKLLILLVFTDQFYSADSHSMDYLLTGVTQEIHLPEVTCVVEVDGLQGGHYDSDSNKVILTGDWAKYNVYNMNLRSEIAETFQGLYTSEMSSLKKLFNVTEGIHTVQVLTGCELYDDGTKTGYAEFGYDGEDTISLDLKTLSWTTANGNGVLIRQKWERTGEAENWRNFLEKTCIEWLQMFVEHGRETLEEKVHPEAFLFQKNSSSPVVCLATGFFPKPVMIYWKKNGEDLEEDVDLRETLPNQDGTFQKRNILTVSPEELNKHDYTCIIQHSSLEQEIVLHVSDHINHGVSVGVLIGSIISAAVVVLLVVIGVLVWRKKKNNPEMGKQMMNDSEY